MNQHWAHNPTMNKLMRRLSFIFMSPRKRRQFRATLAQIAIEDKLLYYRRLAKTIYADSYLIYCRNGIGDIFFAASLMQAFKEQHKGRIVFLTEKPKLKEFLQAFPGIDEVLVDKEATFQHLAIVQRKIAKGLLNFLYFPYRGNKPNHLFADDYTNLLDLDLHTKRQIPQLKKEHLNHARMEFDRLKINPQKTILLIPESVMFDHRTIKATDWIKLAKKLTKEGYDVVFNSTNSAYSGFKTTFLPILDSVAFAQQVRYIVSFRSGINDLFVGMGIHHLMAIYPYNMEVIWADKFLFDELLNKYHTHPFEHELENILNIYSLSSNFNCQAVQEVLYDGDIEDIYKKIKIHCKSLNYAKHKNNN